MDATDDPLDTNITSNVHEMLSLVGVKTQDSQNNEVVLVKSHFPKLRAEAHKWQEYKVNSFTLAIQPLKGIHTQGTVLVTVSREVDCEQASYANFNKEFSLSAREIRVPLTVDNSWKSTSCSMTKIVQGQKIQVSNLTDLCFGSFSLTFEGHGLPANTEICKIAVKQPKIQFRLPKA
jgi:hypothetical protein